jgi:phage terminase large subunit-like protein
VGIAITRLAQRVLQEVEGADLGALKPRMYYDCNPPSKAHWSYQLFVMKRDPDTKQNLANPADYAHFQINPQDNADNLSDGYLKTLEGLSARLQKRFLKGEFADATPNALFTDEIIDTWRVQDGVLPDMVRVVVGVDPSGSGDADNADNDAIGITVGGLGTDGNAYLLEDCTVKAGPATWGKVATDAFDRHAADIVVGEINYGGAMVQHVIQTARQRTPYKQVTATRGKAVRAEPFSALYEQGKIRHAGEFRELEDELAAFSTVGYTGEHSPNRADAWIWVLTELFPGLTRTKREFAKPKLNLDAPADAGAWMR